MLLSSTFFKNAYDRYQKHKQMSKEGFTGFESASAGTSLALDLFILIISFIFLTIEILMIYYAITIAIKCTKAGTGERVAAMALAIFFTFPFMLITFFFNKCGQDTLRNSDFLMSSINKQSFNH